MLNKVSERRDRLRAIGGLGLAPTLYSIQRTSSIAALLIVAAAAWWFLLASEAAMTRMAGDGPIMELMWLMMTPVDTVPYLLAASTMWIAMMIAMMIPAAVPMALIYRRMDRGASSNLDTFIFSCGYLAGWSFYSLGAAGLQWWLHSRGTLHGHLLVTGANLAAAILIAAGVYQLTTAQGGLSQPLPQSARIFHGELEERTARRIQDGPPSWALLRRLLLGIDVAHVRRRSDERRDHGGAQYVHTRRASVAGRAVGLEDSGTYDDGVGWGDILECVNGKPISPASGRINFSAEANASFRHAKGSF